MISPAGLNHAAGLSQRCRRTTLQCSGMPSPILQNRLLSNPAWCLTQWTAISGSLATTMTQPAVLRSHSPRVNAPLSSPNMVFTLGLRHTLVLWQRAMALVQFHVVQASSASFRTGVVKTFRCANEAILNGSNTNSCCNVAVLRIYGRC